jgi:hypothetical protein
MSSEKKQSDKAAPVFQATREQLRDPAWCFEHAADLAKVGKEAARVSSHAELAERFIIQG